MPGCIVSRPMAWGGVLSVSLWPVCIVSRPMANLQRGPERSQFSCTWVLCHTTRSVFSASFVFIRTVYVCFSCW
jgi:hypothetical protein